MRLTTDNARIAAIAALLVAALAVLGGVATAQGPEARGADLLSAVEDGEMDCQDLDGGDYEAMGEFVMGRMLASPRAHEAMDAMMARMMGEAGLESMHQAMGQRLAGCGGAGLPAGFGMMGMMGMMGGGARGPGGPGGPAGAYGPGGMIGGGYGPGGMMGGGFGSGGMMGGGFGSGGMMGFDRDREDDDDDVAGWVAAGTLVLLLAIGAAGLVVSRRRPGSGVASPIDLLEQRLARGEIDADDYRRRRGLIERGGTR